MSMKHTSGKTLVLASSSPRRQELIRSLGLPVEIIVSDVEENTEPGWTPRQIVESLALRKAAAVCIRLDSRGSSRIVVGSDTIVVVDDEVLGKPLHIQDSFRMLSKLQGRTHQVYTGVACLSENYGDEAGLNIGSDAASYRGECCEYTVSNGAAGGRCVVGYSVTNVTFKPMSDDQIDRYISSGEPADKAGSYAAQGIGSTLISKLEGDYFGVVGLPLHLLSEMLREHGILTP